MRLRFSLFLLFIAFAGVFCSPVGQKPNVDQLEDDAEIAVDKFDLVGDSSTGSGDPTTSLPPMESSTADSGSTTITSTDSGSTITTSADSGSTTDDGSSSSSSSSISSSSVTSKQSTVTTTSPESTTAHSGGGGDGGGGFSVGSFFAGMATALGVGLLAFLAYKLYLYRFSRNYRQL